MLQDLFVLQLEGEKQWTVFHRPTLDPLAELALGRPAAADPTPAMDGYSGTPEVCPLMPFDALLPSPD